MRQSWRENLNLFGMTVRDFREYAELCEDEVTAVELNTGNSTIYEVSFLEDGTVETHVVQWNWEEIV